MKILAIETSCDETAVSIIEASGDVNSASFTVLGDALLSQMEMHSAYGGVFPSLAKREHQKNILPLIEKALDEAYMLNFESTTSAAIYESFAKHFKEDNFAKEVHDFVKKFNVPPIDAVAVTYGPGLEPALWVGLSVAKALAEAWKKTLIPINHMEGHILSSLVSDGKIKDVQFPVLALLISGGHTELVLMKDWLDYELVGQTLDDAVGEAFDKVARMLGLPYPGGPQISKHAEEHRARGDKAMMKLPRPMLQSNTCDFSFSGLKTAVLYALRNYPEITDDIKRHVSAEFEDAVTDVLVKKTRDAIESTGARTVVVGGGVSANVEIRRRFKEEIASDSVTVAIPERKLTTDNAIMIGLAGFYRITLNKIPDKTVPATGSLSLA
jgi:N6-L-threonylcarbamoyladenine synthase